MNEVKPLFSFEGRSTRSQYWAINIFCYVGLIASALVCAVFSMSGILGIMSGVVLLVAALIVSTWLVFAVTARRCRDIGISPFFALALLIPYLAMIPFIVFGCLKSEVKDEHTCC
jgi:uncharacterized membrane protein YhaH (DUF805 family)